MKTDNFIHFHRHICLVQFLGQEICKSCFFHLYSFERSTFCPMALSPHWSTAAGIGTGWADAGPGTVTRSPSQVTSTQDSSSLLLPSGSAWQGAILVSLVLVIKTLKRILSDGCCPSSGHLRIRQTPAMSPAAEGSCEACLQSAGQNPKHLKEGLGGHPADSRQKQRVTSDRAARTGRGPSVQVRAGVLPVECNLASGMQRWF